MSHASQISSYVECSTHICLGIHVPGILQGLKMYWMNVKYFHSNQFVMPMIAHKIWLVIQVSITGKSREPGAEIDLEEHGSQSGRIGG